MGLGLAAGFYLLFIICSLSGAISSMISNRETLELDKQMMKTWCVAKPGIDDEILLENINFICSKVNCRDIKEGGPCFYPSTLMNHASVAMNKFNRIIKDCDYNNSGIVVFTDPSYENCTYI